MLALYPQDSGQTLDLTGDFEMAAVLSDLQSIRQTLEAQTEIESKLKQVIQQRMGDATKVIFDVGNVTWKRSKDSNGFDVPKLLNEQPQLLRIYPLIKPRSRRFLINT